MSQEFRITSGGLIDRSKEISFIFNGKEYTGYKGDTLASALLANGVHLIGRSFKYHRPRGIIAAGVENIITKINSLEKISLKFSLLIGIDWLFCIYYEYWFFRLRAYYFFYN